MSQEIHLSSWRSLPLVINLKRLRRYQRILPQYDVLLKAIMGNYTRHLIYTILAVGLMILPLPLLAGNRDFWQQYPQWENIMDWRWFLFKNFWLYYGLLALIGILSLIFYIAVVRKHRWYALGIPLQILSLLAAALLWSMGLFSDDIQLMGTVDLAGKTYHLVRAAPVANYRLDLYACEEGQCHGLTVLFNDSSYINEASLSVDGSQQLVLKTDYDRICRIDPNNLPEFPKPCWR